jgi:hypothetical protein
MNEKVEDIKKNQKLKNIKNHLKENKVTYCVSIGVGVVAFGAGALAFGNGVQIVDSIKITLVNWKSPHTSQTIMSLPARGNRGIVIVHDQTGKPYASIKQAAEELGISRSAIQQQLKGLLDSVSGDTFTSLGENLSEQVKIST